MGTHQKPLGPPLPQMLQQAWKEAQACWYQPFSSPAQAPLRLVLARQAFHTHTSHSLWSNLSQQSVHIYGPDFDLGGDQSLLSPYLTVALAREMGYFYLAPDNAACIAALQLQTRMQLAEHSLSTADAMLHRFLELLVLNKLHSKGLAAHDLLKRQQSFTAQRLPPWMARLYEYLWRLPNGDLTQAYAKAPPLNALEEATACLCHRVFHHQRHGNLLHRHYAAQLKQFLNYAVHHLPVPIETPTPLLMVLPRPLGLPIRPEKSAMPEDNSEQNAAHSPGSSAAPLLTQVSLRGVVQSASSPQQLLSKLPEQKALDLLIQYYRQAAWPYVYALSPPSPQTESVLEGLETWSMDDPIHQLNWQASLMIHPTLIPGITTRQQVQAQYSAQDTIIAQKPRLTLYLDSSQSMPNPHHEHSLVVLTGFVLMLSAWAANWPVRVINWSERESDTGYIHNDKRLSKALLQTPQGATHFPLASLVAAAQNPSTAQDINVLLSDIGTVKSLQQLATTQPSALADLSQMPLHCLLYLPLALAYRQQSLQSLQALLPQWTFHALTHPQHMPRLWGPSHG